MDERWHILTRVRELRARLASNEAARRRQVQAHAQAALDRAIRVQAHYQELALQASAAASLYSMENSEARCSAAEAQVLLSYAIGARLKAQEAMGPVRRAHLVCQHAQSAADEATQTYRRAENRRETVVSRWQKRARAALRLERERQDEALVEDLSSNAAATRDGDV
ncbi:MAG TPA: hypothetical protein VI653_22610 [Steroidobacteraceae bacterium]